MHIYAVYAPPDNTGDYASIYTEQLNIIYIVPYKMANRKKIEKNGCGHIPIDIFSLAILR